MGDKVNLLLLELMVDTVTFRKPQEGSGGTKHFDCCIKCMFFDNEIEVTNADFEKQVGLMTPFVREFKSGKSCLFALQKDQVVEATRSFELQCAVIKRFPCLCINDEVVIGAFIVDITPQFVESYRNSKDERYSTISKSLKKSFPFNNALGEETGEVSLYIRLSCVGQVVVTKLQLPEACTNKFVFKGDESVFVCEKLAGEVSAGECETEQGGGEEEKLSLHAFEQQTDRDEIPYPSPEGDGEGPYEEIIAAINENQLKIRVPKNSKVQKISNEQQSTVDQCTSRGGDGAEGKCPAGCLPATNRIFFQMPDSIRGTGASHHKACVVTSPTDAATFEASKHVYENRDVFILKIGKKVESAGRQSKFEIELITPKRPSKKNPPLETRQTQYEDDEIPPCVKMRQKPPRWR